MSHCVTHRKRTKQVISALIGDSPIGGFVLEANSPLQMDQLGICLEEAQPPIWTTQIAIDYLVIPTNYLNWLYIVNQMIYTSHLHSKYVHMFVRMYVCM